MKWIKANKSMPPMFKDVEWRNANGGNIPLGKMSAIEIYKKAGPNINSFEWLDESPALVEDIQFTQQQIESLQSEVYKITGDGEVMALFNKLLGVQGN